MILNTYVQKKKIENLQKDRSSGTEAMVFMLLSSTTRPVRMKTANKVNKEIERRSEEVFQKTGVLKRLLSCLGALGPWFMPHKGGHQDWHKWLESRWRMEGGEFWTPPKRNCGMADLMSLQQMCLLEQGTSRNQKKTIKKHDLTTNYHMKQNHKILKPSTQHIFHHHTNHRLRALWLSIPYHSMRSPRIPCFSSFPFPCYILHLFHFYCHCKSLERFCFVRVLVCLIWPGKLLWSRILRLE